MSAWATVLIFLVGSIVFVMIGLIAAQIIRPNKPNLEKLSTYESGEETVGDAWGKINIKYIAIAILFLLFEVEIVFLFPWATVYAHSNLIKVTKGAWIWYSLTEMFIFVFILTIGLAYAWSNGFLDWVKPTPHSYDFKSVVPKNRYDDFNKKY